MGNVQVFKAFYSRPTVSLPMFQLQLPLFTGESYCWTFKLLIV